MQKQTSNTITKKTPIKRSLSRQQTAALLNIPLISPGTWLTTPCLNPLNRFNHHFIAIHPLLYCGYNGREINMVNLWGEIDQGQAKKYITKKWKIVRQPKTPQQPRIVRFAENHPECSKITPTRSQIPPKTLRKSFPKPLNRTKIQTRCLQEHF